MNHAPWQLDEARLVASLRINRVSAQVNLARPQSGWQSLEAAGHGIPLVPAQLWFHGDDNSPIPPAAAYVRESDLVATYPASSQVPFTTQVYRRADLVELHGTSLVVLSTLISLNTHLLDARAGLALRTDCQAGDCLLVGAQQQLAEAAPADDSGLPTATLSRPEASDWSYLELVHPADFPLFRRTPEGWECVFTEAMEKGVIRRLHTWGVLLPRGHDLALAAELQQAFAATAPPLTT